MTLTQQQLGEKRARKRLRRKRILEARMRAYGEKSVPPVSKFSTSVIKKITKQFEGIIQSPALTRWQRFKIWFKNLL